MMKRFELAYKTCALLIALFFMVSCEPKVSETFEFSNTEGDLKVKVFGEQPNSFDPWMMTIETIYEDKVINTGQTEAYLSEVNKETVLITWVDEYSAVITFKEKDGEVKVYPVAK